MCEVAPETSRLNLSTYYIIYSRNLTMAPNKRSDESISRLSLVFTALYFQFLCPSYVIMAFRSTSYWRSMVSRLRGASATYATFTTPKMKAYAPAADFGRVQHGRPWHVKGEFVPVYVALGMITLSLSLGLHTAMHHLLRNPSVRVNKKKRETLVEVEDPDEVIDEAERFIHKSFFRKVAHVEEFDNQDIMPDPIRGDAFAHPHHAETLKSVGVDPNLH